MRRGFVLAIAVACSVFFFACEEDAIPIPLPPPVAQNTDNPELLPPPSESAPSSNAPSPVAESQPVKTPALSEMRRMEPVFAEDSEQLKSGRYTVQIALSPSQASAKRLVKKMAESGIRAYYVPIDDPDEGLYGTYYRVRVGYFNEMSAATEFAKTKLQPLGYEWWVDYTRNDNVFASASVSVSKPAPASKPVAYVDPELERAKQEYKEFAKAAAAEKEAAAKQQQQAPPPPPPPPPPPAVKTAPPPPPPPPPPPAVKAVPLPASPPKPVVKEGAKAEMEIDNRGKVRVRAKRK